MTSLKNIKNIDFHGFRMHITIISLFHLSSYFMQQHPIVAGHPYSPVIPDNRNSVQYPIFNRSFKKSFMNSDDHKKRFFAGHYD